MGVKTFRFLVRAFSGLAVTQKFKDSDLSLSLYIYIYIYTKNLKMKKMDSYLALEIGHLHHDSTAGILVTHAI